MDYKSLKTLEYHKIIEKLSSYAGSEAARKMCADLKPMTDINSINDALTQTSDALSRIYAKVCLVWKLTLRIGRGSRTRTTIFQPLSPMIWNSSERKVRNFWTI